MNKKNASILLVFSLITGGTYFYYTSVKTTQQQTKTVQTVYGSVKVSEPVLLELLEHKAFHRLKHINQYGIMAFVKPEQKYTRYEHSLGVFYLLRTFGADLEEQVAGLLHDVSHTAFSHVADFIHDSVLDKYSYQDAIFKWYLSETGLLAVLKKHGLERVADFGNGVEYKMLKDDLPNLCADRLEYNLYGGYVEGWLTAQDMRDIVKHVECRDGQWIFTNADDAKKFAKISIDLSIQNWTSAENAFISTVMASILKQAFKRNIVSKDDFHFSTDQEVMNKLRASKDQDIKIWFAKIDTYTQSYEPGTPQKHDLHFKGKFRGIDPLVSVQNKLIRLSDLNCDFACYLKDQRAACKEHYIAYL